MSPRSRSQTLKLTYHSIGPKPWSLIRIRAVSAGQGRLDLADALVEPLPELDEPRADGREVAPLGDPMRRVPGVPELVLDAVGRHQVEHEQVPLAAVHQEPDGLEVVVEEVGQLGEHLGLIAAVVDRRRPGPIRPDRLLQLGEDRRVAGEVGGVGRAEEVPQVEPGGRPAADSSSAPRRPPSSCRAARRSPRPGRPGSPATS